MNRPAGEVRARAAGGLGDGGGYWLIVGAFVAYALVVTGVWTGGRLGAAVTGHGLAGPPWRLSLPATLIEPRRQVAWPHVPPAALWAGSVLVTVVLLALLASGVWLFWRGLRRKPSPSRSMARTREMAEFTTTAAAQTATRIRPSLAGVAPGQVHAGDRGITLGRLITGGSWDQPVCGPLLQSSWEHVICAIFAPRTGKTTALAVPSILSAPGAVVACSNKADVYLSTAELRQKATELKPFVADFQRIVHVEQGFWWNPLGGAMGLDDAMRLAGAFISAVEDDDKREIWGPAATELLSNLFYAAHLAGRTLVDAYAWLYDQSTEEPSAVLREHGHTAAADSLDGIRQEVPETRGGVYFTARTGMSSIRDRTITCWVTPQPDLPEFRPGEFVASRGTLYLLSKQVKGGTSAAALVSALTTEIRVAAEHLGEQMGGRIDPPLTLVLDEVANICRIPDLPEQYSHLGSRSIVPIAILQSYAQGERVWGRAGMRELWGAATVKIIGSGADDEQFAEAMSRLVGDHDVDVIGYHGGRGGSSRSASPQQRRIMTAADVRAMPKNQAVLLATGVRPALIRLNRWFDGPDKTLIAAAEKRARRALVDRVADETATAAAAGPDRHRRAS